MRGDARSSGADQYAQIAEAIEELYSAFVAYRVGPHVEGCPHCVSDRDHARLYSRPLRSLTADALHKYAFKAMTTWGDANDFRHFLPRILDLMANGVPDLFETEVVLGKLGYANWRTWPEREQAALRSFLRLRWSVGLTQVVFDAFENPVLRSFDADTWLCGVAQAGDEIIWYIEAWRQRGATETIGHVAAFLDTNPDLLTGGRLGNAFWDRDDPQTTACAREMRIWLTACMDDPEFQAQLATHYQSLK